MTTRADITREIELRLGGQMVSVELDPEHYDLAINKALEKYRQRAENAVEEDFYFFEVQPDEDTYRLPDEIIEVRDLYGRASGITSTSTDFEPFEAAYWNTYMNGSQGGTGSLASFDALAQHHETLGRLFGAEYTYTWNRTSKLLRLHRRPRAERAIYAHVYKVRSEDSLFADVYVIPWLKAYALAQAKLMLGEARRKFATIAGPQGGTTLNGEQLIADAFNEIESLENDLKNFKDGSASWGFVIG